MAALSTAASAAIVSTDIGAWPMRLGACWAWALPAPAAASMTAAVIGRRRPRCLLAVSVLRMGMQVAPCGRRFFGPIQPRARGNDAWACGHGGRQQPKPFVLRITVHLAGGKISISAIPHVATIRFMAVADTPMPPVDRVSAFSRSRDDGRHARTRHGACRMMNQASGTAGYALAPIEIGLADRARSRGGPVAGPVPALGHVQADMTS